MNRLEKIAATCACISAGIEIAAYHDLRSTRYALFAVTACGLYYLTCKQQDQINLTNKTMGEIKKKIDTWGAVVIRKDGKVMGAYEVPNEHE